MDSFVGLPDFTDFLLERMSNENTLKNFIPFELCNLEYLEERSAGIEFHMDDSWIWGDRLIRYINN